MTLLPTSKLLEVRMLADNRLEELRSEIGQKALEEGIISEEVYQSSRAEGHEMLRRLERIKSRCNLIDDWRDFRPGSKPYAMG